jgi:hypothetical protein
MRAYEVLGLQLGTVWEKHETTENSFVVENYVFRWNAGRFADVVRTYPLKAELSVLRFWDHCGSGIMTSRSSVSPRWLAVDASGWLPPRQRIVFWTPPCGGWAMPWWASASKGGPCKGRPRGESAVAGAFDARVTIE